MLGLVTSDYLYHQHPNEHEGQLTKTKSLLVSKAILSRRALAMGLGRFVLMSHSEIESGGRQRLSIVADAFESVIGAIYLDLGFEAAREFIQKWLLRDYREIAADKRHTNYKSHLQEYVQSTFRTHPIYRIRSEMGPDHSKQFMVEVMVGRRTLGTGRGRNKKEAEQAAARDALDKAQVHPSDRVPDAERLVESRPEAREPREGREAREPREGREAREPREGREAREPRFGRGSRGPSGPAPEAEVAPAMEPERLPEMPPAAPTLDAPTPADEEGASDGTRRRRGRRGGRGRRARSEAPPVAPAVEPPARPAGVVPTAPARPAAPIGRAGVRRVRSEPPAYLEEPRLPEVEPLPPAYEEDENEEIGRPEGPLEERHVDPYAVDVEPASRSTGLSRAERGGGRSVEPGYVLPARSDPEPEDEWPAATDVEEEAPGAGAFEPPAGEPEREEALASETEMGMEFDPENVSEPTPSPEPTAHREAEAPARGEARFGRRPGRRGR